MEQQDKPTIFHSNTYTIERDGKKEGEKRMKEKNKLNNFLYKDKI